MTKNLIVIGTQFGDEGKGKIVDFFAKNFDIIARFSGGPNAGHTIKINDKQFIQRQIPSGIFYPQKTCVIGNGCIIDPIILLEEMAKLKKGNQNIGNLLIDERAHIIMPYHITVDWAEEKLKGNLKAGTTKKGIGPCYSDKIARFGIRVIDLLSKVVLRKKISLALKKHAEVGYSVSELLKKYHNIGFELKKYITNCSVFLDKSIKQEKTILFEGAQGTHIDIDHGIYPFCTSSNTIAANACSGTGLGPKSIGKVVGAIKAYTTRVGTGPFITEIFEKESEHLRNNGNEFGSVTGRSRRCGWLDLVMIEHSIRVNGIDEFVLTKLDVLSGLPSIKVCYAYEDEFGNEIKYFPSDAILLDFAVPKYIELKGWEESISNCKCFDDLPIEAKEYIHFIESQTNIPIKWISNGAERNQIFERTKNEQEQ